MAGNIKGITIEIDGDTKGLDKALKGVNTAARSAQSELKDVEKALKLDPSNVDLVNQKMDVLGDAVNAASNKLKVLRQAQAQVEQQFANGDIGEEQYRAFQRELIQTENAMKQYQQQMGNIQNEQKRLSDTTRAMGAFFDATGSDVEDFASVLGTRLTQAIKSGTATADQMERAIKLMGTAALGAGTDIDQMRTILNGINNGNSIDDVRNALNQLNQTVVSTQAELKEVEQLLKLDPGNTTALAQKQQLLTQAINETTNELQQLQQRQQQVEAAFASGDMGADEYRQFQREIAQTEAALAQYQAQLTGMSSDTTRFNQAQQGMQNYLAATGQSIDDLSSVLGSQLTNAIRSGSASSDQLEQALRRLGQQAGHSGNELEEFQRIIRNVDGSANLDQIRRDLDRIGDAANAAEADVEGLADGLNTAATAASAAMGAFGAGAGLAAAQFDNAAGQIQAGLGVTAEEAKKLESLARNVWKAGFGESLEEVSAGLIRVKQNMKQIDGSEIEKVTQNALALAKSFESDVNEVTRAGNNLMVNFGVSADEAFDLMARGAQDGINFSNEMFDNLAEYSPLFASMGYSADEYFGILKRGSEQG